MLRTWNLSLDFKLLRQRGVPMYQTLADELRRLIEKGVLRRGDVLPSSRELAQQLGISRKTVVTAMNLLIDYGLLERQERVGLFVGRAGEAEAGMDDVAALPAPVPHLVLGPDMPDVSLLPAVAISRAYRNCFNRAARLTQLGYDVPKGNEALRDHISAALCHSRGLCATKDEVMVTRGSLQGIYLVAHALLQPGDAVAIEALAAGKVRQSFESAGLRLIDLPVDHDGVRVDALAEALSHEERLRAIYVTPRINYPTTATLSPERRAQLAALVVEHQLLVIEDDFDGFISTTGHLDPPFSAVLPKSNYVYLCTGTRILAPAIRLGFVTASLDNIERIAYYRSFLDLQGDVILDRALCELIEQGEMRRHIRNSCQVYTERLDYISRRIRQELRDCVWYRRPVGGLSIWLEMHGDPTQKLLDRGIVAQPVDLGAGRFGLHVCYASLSREQVDLLVDALKGLNG